MITTDPIADMLTRMRNALTVKHKTVSVPASKMKVAIAELLKNEGYINDYSVTEGTKAKATKKAIATTPKARVASESFTEFPSAFSIRVVTRSSEF